MPRSGPDPILLSTVDGRLQVEFTWHLDRFIHRLILDGNEVARSIEGTAEQAWPSAPPIQQLSLEQLDVGSVVLGVGAAGRSHWSISVRSCPEYPAALRFDLACRTNDSPTFLGSRYEFDPAVELEPVVGERIFDSEFALLCPTAREKPTCQWSYRVRARE